MDIKDMVEPNIMWNLGKGNISFLWDSWSNLGPLAQLVQNRRTPKTTLVNYFYKEGTWNRNKILKRLPPSVVTIIMNTSYNITKEDSPIWMPSHSGEFSCKTAWQNLRKKKGTTLPGSCMWNKSLPFKICFFIMLVILDKVPTDIVVKRSGVNLSSICNYCKDIHCKENTYHLFSESCIANKVWSFFNNSCGVKTDQVQVRERAMKLWLTKPNNKVHRLILHYLPNIIYWQIWKSRCAVRYDNKSMCYWSINHQLIKMIIMVIHNQFPSLHIPEQ